MNTQGTHQDYLVYLAADYTLVQRQARRRRLLGIALIVVGSLWLCLRLIGWVGDLPLPIDYWVDGAAAMLERFNTGDLALSASQAACGMLATHTIHARYNHAEQ